MTLRTLVVAAALLAAANAGAAGKDEGGGEAAAAPATLEAKTAPSWDVHVNAFEEFQVRASPTPDETDQDLHLGLDLSASHASRKFLANASLGLWYDTDGRSAPGLGGIYDSPLRTIDDPSQPRPNRPWFNAFTLYGDWVPGTMIKVVRAGRQSSEHGRPVTFDGAYTMLRAGKFALFGFGGRTEHFYDVDQDLFENWIGSVGVQARPGPDLKLEVDYRFLREALPSKELSAGRDPLQDHNYGLAAWFKRGSWLYSKLSVRGVNSTVSEVGLLGKVYSDSLKAGLDGRVYVQPSTLEDFAELDNPFFQVLGQSLPHARWRLDGFKTLPTGFASFEGHLGYDGRQLIDGEEGPFNRNTSRLYLLVSGTPNALKGLTLSVSLDRFSTAAFPLLKDSNDDGSGLWAVGGAAAYDFGDGKYRAELGTDYHQWQYTYFRDVQEYANVRATYLGARAKLNDWLAVRARYQVEIFDRTLHTFSLGLAQAY